MSVKSRFDKGGFKKIYRSMLYIPGNNPGMLQHAPIFGADSVLLDLEDSVSPGEKDAARRLTSKIVKELDFGEVMVTVRINGADTPYFEKDIEEVVSSSPDAIRLPKCSSPKDVTDADVLISEAERNNGIEAGSVKIHAMIETARGVANVYDIASSSKRLSAITLGGQDLIADLGAIRTKGGAELMMARGQVVLAAKSASLDVYDTVWTDINDLDGLFEETRHIMSLGFSGKAAVHPSQVPVIHRAFMPEEQDIVHASRVVSAAQDAESRGIGVFSVDGKMVDSPVVTRAYRILELARLGGRSVTV